MTAAATQTLLFEIGCEELPAAPLAAATRALGPATEKALDEARLAHGTVEVRSTPRRIVVTVTDVASATEALEQRFRGPAAKIAFDADGNPTKAAEGFARGKGIDASELEVADDESGTPYVWANVSVPSVAATDLLTDILPALIKGISWPRSQRWGSGRETFGRPVRWIVALLGSEVIEFSYAGVESGRVTRGHRLIKDANRTFEIADADAYDELSEEMRVITGAAERAESIRSQIAAIEEETGLSADLPKATFDEVVNLVEWPTVLVGHFDERFLDIPPEIVCDAMLSHQRYFPMRDSDGALSSAFLIVSNGDPAFSEAIREGNERVVRARLDDAAFFVAEDEREPLASYLPRLKDVVFQEKLGTVMEKSQRIGIVTRVAYNRAGASKPERMDCMRAAMLCKCDLVTQAVVEFTSLEGVMGGHYAIASGESPEVATAIREHYQPRFAGDDVPSTFAGRVVALADKLDTICGMFSIGEAPTSSSDPFACRRAALGIIAILRAEAADHPKSPHVAASSGAAGSAGADDSDEPRDPRAVMLEMLTAAGSGGGDGDSGPTGDLSRVTLAELVEISLHAYHDRDGDAADFDIDAVQKEVTDFFVTRVKVLLRDEGASADAIDAVLAAGVTEPLEVIARVGALETARAESPELFCDLATAHARADNLRDPSLGTDCDESLFGDAERSLAAAVEEASAAVGPALKAGDYPAALASLAGLRAPIDAFFEDVLVMADDESLRANRLKLLNRFVAVFTDVADIGKLAG